MKSKTFLIFCLINFNIFYFQLASDAFFASGIIGFAQNIVRTCPAPIYFHILSLCRSRNGFRLALGVQEPGVCHGDDLGYFFTSSIHPFIPNLPISPGSIEEKAISRYMRLWGNFLKYGDPTPDQKEFGVTWKPITTDATYYLDVDEELELKINPDEQRIKLWREIFKSHENTKNFLP